MTYLYYPGCSLEGTAREYDISTRALMRALGAELIDIDDWTCCGASAAEAVDHHLSLALPARNLALAQRMNSDMETRKDILAPCSACYLNLKKVSEAVGKDRGLSQVLNTILAEDGLTLNGPGRVRHLLDVLSTDVGAEKIRGGRKRSFDGMRIAPYYGCQCLRPYSVFDDPEKPRSMEPLIGAVGARIHPWDMGGRCCGANHMNTKPDVGTALVAGILRAAEGADAVLTVCPMCQMNLEGFQRRISKMSGRDLTTNILYLPQFLGLAIGLTAHDVGLDPNLAVRKDFWARLRLSGEGLMEAAAPRRSDESETASFPSSS